MFFIKHQKKLHVVIRISAINFSGSLMFSRYQTFDEGHRKFDHCDVISGMRRLHPQRIRHYDVFYDVIEEDCDVIANNNVV